MSNRAIDPFKHIGTPDTWGEMTLGTSDIACDAERRSLCDHFLRRLRKLQKTGVPPMDGQSNLMAGSALALAGLWFSMQGGPNGAQEDDFEKFIGVMTHSYYNAMSCFDDEPMSRPS